MHNLKNNNTNMLLDQENSRRFLNPSFSSTLLDQIYRSIDEGDNTKSPQMKFYRETTKTEKKQNRKWTETTTMDSKRRYNNKVSENVVGFVGTEKMDRRRRSSRDYDHDQDVMFFSSTSLSSDSSSSSSSSSGGGGLSSSDTESLYGIRTRSSSSCFAPSSRSKKHVRTDASFRYEEQGDPRRINSFRHESNAELGIPIGHYDEALLIKSKSRALKIYNNLKKVKQPISPGGKITSFLNSIFASSKKTRSTCQSSNNIVSTTAKPCHTKHNRLHTSDDAIISHKNASSAERNAKSVQTSSSTYFSASTSDSASLFSRSCLSKTNSSERDKLCNGAKRTVRFYPVMSVVVGEDCRPYTDKRVCGLEEGKVKSIGKSSTMKNMVAEKSKVVEKAAREFLEEHNRNNNNNNNKNKRNNDLVLKDLNLHINTKINVKDQNDDNYNDDEDGASCASSDLFELDHLDVFGSGRYCEELPVYETTHVSTNRAIANGLLV